MKKRAIAILVLLLALINQSPASADYDLYSSNRMDHRAGLYLSILGDPFPSLTGANVGINVTDFLRVHGGLGYTTGEFFYTSFEILTFGAGAKLMVPGWDFTPTLNFALASAVGVSEDIWGDRDYFGASDVMASLGLGVDYVSPTGFNIAVGANVPAHDEIAILPYLNLGWYF